MAEDCCFLNKDALITRPQKKNPCALRMTVIIFVMISGIYIFLICLKQKESTMRPNLVKVKLLEKPCPDPRTSQADDPRMHYPEPTSYRRNECKCTPVVFFAIVSMQRSGSGWFETLLNSHINVSSNGEIFSVKERRCNMPSISRALDKVYNLDWFSSASKNECTAAVGYKWMLNQVSCMTSERANLNAESKDDLRTQLPLELLAQTILSSVHTAKFRRDVVTIAFLGWHNYDPPEALSLPRLLQGLMQNHEEIVSYFNRRGVSVIFLFRRNYLRRWVSVLGNDHDRMAKQLNGTHKAHVHSQDEADVLARYKPMINVSLLIPTLKQADKLTADVLKYFMSTRHMVLYYEDLVQNVTKLMDVLEFLSVPQRKLFSRHVKIHTRPLSDQVENWDAISKALKGTEYEIFLHSDYGT